MAVKSRWILPSFIFSSFLRTSAGWTAVQKQSWRGITSRHTVAVTPWWTAKLTDSCYSTRPLWIADFSSFLTRSDRHTSSVREISMGDGGDGEHGWRVAQWGVTVKLGEALMRVRYLSLTGIQNTHWLFNSRGCIHNGGKRYHCELSTSKWNDSRDHEITGDFAWTPLIDWCDNDCESFRRSGEIRTRNKNWLPDNILIPWTIYGHSSYSRCQF